MCAAENPSKLQKARIVVRVVLYGRMVEDRNETRLESHSEQKSQFVAPGLGPNFWHLRLPSKPVWLSCQQMDDSMMFHGVGFEKKIWSVMK